MKDSVAELNIKRQEIDETIKNNVTNSIAYIKFLIQNAHYVADVMPLAMRFNSSSKLVLNSPPSALDPSIHNEISLVFKTNADNGLLFFIGNQQQPDNNGFLALEIVNLSVYFHFRLNSGSTQTLKSNKVLLKNRFYILHAERLKQKFLNFFKFFIFIYFFLFPFHFFHFLFKILFSNLCCIVFENVEVKN